MIVFFLKNSYFIWSFQTNELYDIWIKIVMTPSSLVVWRKMLLLIVTWQTMLLLMVICSKLFIRDFHFLKKELKYFYLFRKLHLKMFFFYFKKVSVKTILKFYVVFLIFYLFPILFLINYFISQINKK